MAKTVPGSERQREAAEMRLRGLGYTAIGRAMVIGRSRAQQLVRQAAAAELVTAELRIEDSSIDRETLRQWLISAAAEDGLTLTFDGGE
jgi:hypothetical protein